MTSDQAKGQPARVGGTGVRRGWRAADSEFDTLKHQRAARRRSLRRGLWFEGLEGRLVLSTITWNTTTAPTGGDWDTSQNWTPAQVPTASDTAVIKGLTGNATVYLDSGFADSVDNLTTDSTTTLEVINGSLSLGAASSSTLGGPVIVSQGASLSVGAGASVTISAGQTLTDDGSLSFASGDTVTMGSGFDAPSQIAVGGTLTAKGTTFNASGGYTASIAINANGHLTAAGSTFKLSSLSLNDSSVYGSGDLTGDTFNMPIYVPYGDVEYLGGNASFDQIEINADTISSGTLALNQIGTNTTNLSYVFYQGFTIASGGTVAVGTNVPVAVNAGETLTDDGTLTFASGDTVTMGSGFDAPSQIAVGGTLTAKSTTLNATGGYTTSIVVNPNGHLTAASSTFNLGSLSLNDSSVYGSGDLTGDIFNMPIYVPYGDVQYLGGNTSFDQIEINADTISSGTLALNQIGTNTTNLSYVFDQGFTIASGGTVAVGTNVPVAVNAGETLTDDGTLTFASGDTVTMGSGFDAPSQIAVGGTLTAKGTTFNATGGYTTSIVVNPNGHLTAASSTFNLGSLSLNDSSVYGSGDLTGDTFNMPIYVPYGDVQYLGGNTSFDQIEINSGTISSGTLALNQIGTNTTNLSYVFDQGFTIASGGTMAVGTNVPVAVNAGETLTDDGTLTFASGDTVTMGSGFDAPSQIAVGGTLTAKGTTFNATGGYTTSIVVNPNGHLTAASSTFNLGSLSVNNSSVYGSGDLTGDIFNMPIYVPYGDVQYLGGNTSFDQIEINSGTISNGTLALNQIGTNTANLSYVFDQSFTVASGGTVAVGTNVPVAVNAGETLTDDGTLTFASGDTVTMGSGFDAPSQIVVGGTLTAKDTTLNATGGYTTSIVVNPSGHLTAASSTFNLSSLSVNNSSVYGSGDLTGDTFNMPIYVPYGDVQYLGGNASFDQIEINSGTISNGTLALNPIGTNTANLSYVFYQGFTIASGTIVAVGTNVFVAVSAGQTLTDNGTLTFAIGDTVTMGSGFDAPSQIAVGGTLTANGTTFNAAGGYTTSTTINSGGELSLSNSSYSLSSLNLNSGSTDSMNVVVFSGQLNVNSGANVGTTTNPTITGDDFSNVGNQGIVAIGDPNASIPLSGNYWGTSVISAIEAKILDHNTDSSRPTIDYQPFVSTASGTSADPATAPFSTTDQTVSLTATVSTSPAGVAISGGTETFTILNGTQVIGQTTTPAQVSNGSATAQYTLPGNTPAGQYIIEASYSGYSGSSESYLPATDISHFLTVSPAGTTTTVKNASATFSATSNQSIPLSAQVSSTAGTINEGIVTFTILSGGNPVGSPVIENVVNDAAAGSYTLLAGTPGGSYTIQAVYTDPVDFTTSSNTNTLTVSAATTTITPSNAATTYNASTAEGITLSANVSSPAGIPNEGAVTFTILNGSTQLVSPIVVNVVNGVASTIYGLPAGTAVGSYIIQAVFDGTASYAKSNPVDSTLTVVAAASKWVIHTEPSSSATAGQAFGIQPVVYEEDSNGNIVSTDNTTSVTATIGSGTGPLTGTVTVTVVDGVATFTNLAADTADTITITFSGANLTSATSSTIAISPAGASQLVVTQQPSGRATAGQPFATQPLVSEEDQYGNVVTTDSTHTVTAVRGQVGSSSLQGTNLTVTLVGGVATFSGLSYDVAELMDISFSTNASGVTSTSSNDVVVSAGAATQLVINQQPSPTATAGQPFATQPIVYEEDQYHNLETGDNSTVVTAILSTGVGPPIGTTTATVSGGVARFTNLGDQTAETAKLEFTSGTMASSPSNAIVVGSAPASKLVIATQPSSTATAGQTFAVQPVIDIEDASGNIETTDNSSVITVALASGTGPLQGKTLSVTAVNGVATFSGLGDNTAETISLKFSGDGLTVGPSNNIVVSPAAAFRLKIQTQPAPTATAGQAFSTQPVIDELDQYGNLETTDSSTVITAAVSFGNGTLAGTTTATVVGGVATFTNLADTAIGTISLGFAGGGLSVGPSNQIVINPGAATQLVIQTQPYASVTAGNPLTDPIVVDEEDQYGNIVTTDNSTVVTASLATGAGTLNGTTTATVVNGVASFNDLEDNTAGALTLQFAAGNLPAVVSNSSVVSPAAASALVVKKPPKGVISGVAFPIEVDAQDPYGNLATSFNGPVTVGLASGSGTLTGTTTVTAAGGVATFTNLVSTTSGSISLDAGSTGLASSPPTDPIPVSPAAAAKLVVKMQPSQTATAGQAFATQPVILIEDQYGNLETGDNSSVVTAFLDGGAGPLQGTLTATASGGVATFAGLLDDTAETITLGFTGDGLTSAPSVPIVVSPAAPSQLAITQEPSSTATVHQAFATQPVVKELDKYGNLETTDSSTVVTATLKSGNGPLLGTTSITLNGGVGSFTDLSDNTPESITLSFSGGGLTTAPSVSIVVSPAATDKLVIQTQPSQAATAGQALTTEPVVYEEDQYGNLETGDKSTAVTAYLASGTGVLQGTTSVTLKGGVATFTNLVDDTAGTLTLGFTGGGLTSAASISIEVSPAAASKLVIQTQPSSTATAGQAFAIQPVVDEEDPYGNLETGDNSTVVTAGLSTGSGPLRGTTSVTVKGGIATFAGLSDDLAETLALKFSGGGLTSDATNTIVVSPTTAAKLVIQTQPSSAAKAGEPFVPQPVIEEEDQYGNLETGDSSTVVAASLASGTGPLQGTTSVTMKDGVATFTNLTDSTIETITLNFSGGGLTVGPTTSIVVTPVTTQLVIHTQPSSTAMAGQAFATQPVIYEEDLSGNLETGDNSTVITVSLASGPGSLQGTTSVTLKGGVASFTNLADDTAGSLTLGFTGGGLTSAASTSIVISPAAASKLVIQTQPSSTATAGQAFATQPVIDEEDPYGNLERGDNSTVVTAALSTGSGPLRGTTSVTMKGGIATFAGLSDDLAETLALKFSGNGLTSAPTNAIVVSPATASQLAVQTQPSSTATAGQAFSTQPVVDEEDRYGNLETGDNSTVVTVSLASGPGSIQGTTSVTLKGGVAIFTNLSDDTAGAVSLKFTGGGLTPSTGGATHISATTATQLVVTTPPPNPLTAGQAFIMVVATEDQFHNVNTSYDGSVTIALANDPGLTTTVQAKDGVATFAGLTVTAAAQGGSIQATATGLTSAATPTITVTPTPTPTSTPTPTITGEQVVMTQKKNKKGKPKGKPVLTGYVLDFSTAMNPATARNAANYQMTATTIKKVKKKTITGHTPVSLTAVYNAATNSVTLTLAGKQAFAKGGEITIIYTPPTGVSSEAGVPLDSSDAELTISTKGTGISLL